MNKASGSTTMCIGRRDKQRRSEQKPASASCLAIALLLPWRRGNVVAGGRNGSDIGERLLLSCIDWLVDPLLCRGRACNVTTLMASMHPAGHQLSCSRPQWLLLLLLWLKCQLETMSMALGKASLRLGTQPAARAGGLQSSIARRGCCYRRYDINIIMSNGNFLLRSPLPSILHATWMRSE